MERCLILIKPDAMKRNLATTILSRFESQGLKMTALKMLHMNNVLAERHYAVHTEKPFFRDLIEYMTSTPIVAAVFAGEQALEKISRIVGATNPVKAEPGTIRRDFGLDITQNSVHRSDAPETAETEIRLFFTKDEIFDY
ncbi:MAG: nucleoside-diphosphate kinase [Chloroflexi bacterium]|nr:nucleoside-diphosphate kinase [Chloroflexota bacterium]